MKTLYDPLIDTLENYGVDSPITSDFFNADPGNEYVALVDLLTEPLTHFGNACLACQTLPVSPFYDSEAVDPIVKAVEGFVVEMVMEALTIAGHKDAGYAYDIARKVVCGYEPPTVTPWCSGAAYLEMLGDAIYTNASFPSHPDLRRWIGVKHQVANRIDDGEFVVCRRCLFLHAHDRACSVCLRAASAEIQNLASIQQLLFGPEPITPAQSMEGIRHQRIGHAISMVIPSAFTDDCAGDFYVHREIQRRATGEPHA